VLALRIYLLAGMVLHKAVWELLKRRMGGPRRLRTPFRPIKALKLAVLLGLLAQGAAPFEVFPILEGDEAWPLRLTGAAVYTVGLATAVWARVALGNNWSDIESATILPEQKLVRHGPYRLVRHPIYLGDVLLVTGYELALNSWLTLGGLPLAAFVWRKARREEKLLEVGLEGYQDYEKRSGAFLPKLRNQPHR